MKKGAEPGWQWTELEPGVRMRWYAEGKGKPVVFVHGLAGFATLWSKQIQDISNIRTCYALDLPGNGGSPAGDYPYSMFFYAESVARWMEKELSEPAILVGHSMGGQISMLLSIRYPALVDQLCLIAPAGFEKFNPWETLMMEQMMQFGDQGYMNLAHIDQTIYRSFYQNNTQAADIIRRIRGITKEQPSGKWSSMIRKSVSAMLAEPVADYLHLLNMPVEIIFGEKDAFIPNTLLHPLESTIGLATKAAAKIPNARLNLIPDAGHFVHLEKSELVNSYLRNFMR